MDGELADALILTSDPEGLLLDLAADLVEVSVAFVYVKELAPFCDIGVAFGGGGVDELEDERSAGDDAGAAGEEVAADDATLPVRSMPERDEVYNIRFKHTGLSRRLAANLRCLVSFKPSITLVERPTTASWGMSSSPPVGA